METEIINGRAIAQEILSQIKTELFTNKIRPKLLIIQVGNVPASTQYVELKKKRGAEVGIEVIHEIIDASLDVTVAISDSVIRYKDDVDGIMIQLPLPKNVVTEEILSLIPIELDVDGLRLRQSPWNTAVADAVLYVMKNQTYISRTSPVLVLGDAPYVGGSIISALKKEEYEYIFSINEDTQHKAQHLRKAKVVISCIGKPHLYKVGQLHKGTVLIDVGISTNTEGKVVGDFDTVKAPNYLQSYTPVPGGIGPMTVAFLLKHVAENAMKRHSL